MPEEAETEPGDMLELGPHRLLCGDATVAEDVERHLDGDPVIARGDSAAYRGRKFIARHRWAVGAAAVGVLSLAGGIVTTSWQAREASEQAALATVTIHFNAPQPGGPAKRPVTPFSWVRRLGIEKLFR